jgi:hypothetical protein
MTSAATERCRLESVVWFVVLVFLVFLLVLGFLLGSGLLFGGGFSLGFGSPLGGGGPRGSGPSINYFSDTIKSWPEPGSPPSPARKNKTQLFFRPFIRIKKHRTLGGFQLQSVARQDSHRGCA